MVTMTMPLIWALKGVRQADSREFQASLVYVVEFQAKHQAPINLGRFPATKELWSSQQALSPDTLTNTGSNMQKKEYLPGPQGSHADGQKHDPGMV